MAFIFPISCILALIFPILIKYFPKCVGKGSFPKSQIKSLMISFMTRCIAYTTIFCTVQQTRGPVDGLKQKSSPWNNSGSGVCSHTHRSYWTLRNPPAEKKRSLEIHICHIYIGPYLWKKLNKNYFLADLIFFTMCIAWSKELFHCQRSFFWVPTAYVLVEK